MSLLTKLTSKKILNVLDESEYTLDPASKEFASRVFSEGFDKYTARIMQYGFQNAGSVLDAGCGFGQWALSFAALGNRVNAIDVSFARLAVLKNLSSVTNFNIGVSCGSLSHLPYRDDLFDVVFCYGALFCTPWTQSLSELVRVLKPGGYLYVNANGVGYYINRWQNRKNESSSFDPAKTVGLAFTNAWRHAKGLEIDVEGQVLIEPEDLTRSLIELGMTDVRRDGEGKLKSSDYAGECAQPFFPADYKGLCGTYEIIGRKE